MSCSPQNEVNNWREEAEWQRQIADDARAAHAGCAAAAQAARERIEKALALSQAEVERLRAGNCCRVVLNDIAGAERALSVTSWAHVAALQAAAREHIHRHERLLHDIVGGEQT